ncbi:DNA-3-methyladenine glycosylase III [Mariprofundus ferrinatatus]|uniref:DNA-3-methyladenine glycosylase III n=1 Tax=Mariprofundus ferrinatatus TaxID=1921087 RepID=A0A2K8L9S6_9PROT|nr:endonuclease III domain-containing protein [Mariprofundus ferrinatatus]ATX81694.1 DNA-3-methyladenine glycosylase III [Mariprofundus ferrinatatus]
MSRTSPMQVYDTLFTAYGPQHWWPAEKPFEVMVGAILTQNTNWRNVEKAIANLKAEKMLDYASIASSNREKLAELIRPSGFFNQKSERLQQFSIFYMQHGKTGGLKKWPKSSLRKKLLGVPGIGPETADSILLYALDKPVFVVDAYTRRIFTRLGLLPEKIDYDGIQVFFENRLTPALSLYQEYHALIVEHAKRHCQTKPLCEDCPLGNHCPTAKQAHPDEAILTA